MSWLKKLPGRVRLGWQRLTGEDIHAEIEADSPQAAARAFLRAHGLEGLIDPSRLVVEEIGGAVPDTPEPFGFASAKASQ